MKKSQKTAIKWCVILVITLAIVLSALYKFISSIFEISNMDDGGFDLSALKLTAVYTAIPLVFLFVIMVGLVVAFIASTKKLNKRLNEIKHTDFSKVPKPTTYSADVYVTSDPERKVWHYVVGSKSAEEAEQMLRSQLILGHLFTITVSYEPITEEDNLPFMSYGNIECYEKEIN